MAKKKMGFFKKQLKRWVVNGWNFLCTTKNEILEDLNNFKQILVMNIMMNNEKG
jgi:hypothetical protein